jgi:hypothetical protein
MMVLYFHWMTGAFISERRDFTSLWSLYFPSPDSSFPSITYVGDFSCSSGIYISSTLSLYTCFLSGMYGVVVVGGGTNVADSQATHIQFYRLNLQQQSP